jgi:hypothetical protein
MPLECSTSSLGMQIRFLSLQFLRPARTKTLTAPGFSGSATLPADRPNCQVKSLSELRCKKGEVMQNQQEDTFVFESVNGFLKRYQADAKFAQEARKKAAGVVDGSIQLICPEDIRPLALRLFRRLVNSETVLFSFYSSVGKDANRRLREQMIRSEFGERLRNNANFAKFVLCEVAPAAACGRMDLRCKSEHRRVLKALLQQLWDEQSATKNGWQTLVKRTHPLTGKLTLTKVAPWELEEDDFTQNSGRDFQVIQRLGYKADVTWEVASELDAQDPTWRVQLHGASAPCFEHARFHRDTSRNLDPLSSPHFGDDDDIEERARIAERADELVSEATEAIYRGALSELESGAEVVSSFVPPLPPQKSGRGGTSAYWASELAKGVRVHKAQRTTGPRWSHKAPSDEWLMSRKAAQQASEEEKARSELLAADDAEAREHASRDVPETIVSLLETQLEEGKRKAPRGVVGALAAARLEAWKHAKSMPSQLQGLAALEKAVAAA